MSRNYPRVSVEEFGAHLLSTGDLDPVYLAVNRMVAAGDMDLAQRNRWLTAYCAYYHCGAACWLSEHQGPTFWGWVGTAARNNLPAPPSTEVRWPRGHERRHFRGGQASLGIADWAKRWPAPEQMFAHIALGDSPPGGPPPPVPFDVVRNRALAHRSVGTWLSFKCVDLVDACMGVEVSQDDAEPFLYETPRNSLLQIWRDKQGLPDTAKPKDEGVVLRGVLDYLRRQFRDHTIPHKPGKPVDLFCLETIACKYGSHLNGHYPLWNDVDEIRAGLEPWKACSRTARLFAMAMPSQKS